MRERHQGWDIFWRLFPRSPISEVFFSQRLLVWPLWMILLLEGLRSDLPTDSVYASRPVCNAARQVFKCREFSAARGKSQSPKLPLFRPIPQTLFLPCRPGSRTHGARHDPCDRSGRPGSKDLRPEGDRSDCAKYYESRQSQACSCSLQSRQRRVHGTASRRGLDMGSLQASHSPFRP